MNGFVASDMSTRLPLINASGRLMVSIRLSDLPESRRRGLQLCRDPFDRPQLHVECFAIGLRFTTNVFTRSMVACRVV